MLLTSSGKYEYANGSIRPWNYDEVTAMSGARSSHNYIVANVHAALALTLRQRNCRIHLSDQPVHVSACEAWYLPDLSITYTPPIFRESPTGLDALENPVVIIKVLSLSTMAYDLGEKFDCYRTLPSLQQYVVINSRERRVQSFTMVDEKEVKMRTATQPGESVTVAGSELKLADIYFEIDFTGEK